MVIISSKRCIKLLAKRESRDSGGEAAHPPSAFCAALQVKIYRVIDMPGKKGYRMIVLSTASANASCTQKSAD
jgi:hypothetical protein